MKFTSSALLALFGTFAVASAGESGESFDFDWWFRWTFYDGFYPSETPSEDAIDAMLGESAAYYLENLKTYQVGAISDLAESNIVQVEFDTEYEDCIFPAANETATTPTIWCPVSIEVEHNGPLFGADSPPGATPAVSLVEDSVTETAIENYITNTLWNLGDEWYFVGTVQVGGDPDPTRNADNPGTTASVERDAQELSDAMAEMGDANATMADTTMEESTMEETETTEGEETTEEEGEEEDHDDADDHEGHDHDGEHDHGSGAFTVSTAFAATMGLILVRNLL